MPRSTKTVSIAELETKAEHLVRHVRRRRDPVVITDDGRASAVLLGYDAFGRAADEREILLQLARGEREIRAGRGSSLSRVLADVDEVLRRRRR